MKFAGKPSTSQRHRNNHNNNNSPLAVSVALVLLIALTILLNDDRSLAWAQRKSKCSEARDREMDLCSAQMGFLGDHSFVVPKNLSAAEGFCRKLKNSISCLQAYSRDCLQGFTKQLLTSLMRRGRQQYQTICQSDRSKLDLSRKLACLSDDRIGQLHLCVDASIGRYEFIRDQVKSEFKLPSLCCSYSIFERDLDETLGRICGKRSPPSAQRALSGQSYGSETQEFVHKMASSTAGEFFSLICDNHQSIDECKQSDKTRDSLRKLEQVSKQVKAGKVQPRSKSLIPVLLDILDSSEPI